MSIESHWKGANSIFHVIYTSFDDDKCLFFTNVSENVAFGRFVKIVQNGELGTKWLNIRFA